MTLDSQNHEVRSQFQLTSSRRGWLRGVWKKTQRIYFNSHPHEEDDKQTVGAQYMCFAFQLTSSRRGWQGHTWSHSLKETFQLTSSRRGWPKDEEISEVMDIFQLTSSRRGWLPCHLKHRRWLLFQLTSSRRGWQWKLPKIKLPHFISTHILTKRMTAILNKNNLFKIAYYINNKHFISIVDIFFHFHIYF